jgi:hypothetical protein
MHRGSINAQDFFGVDRVLEDINSFEDTSVKEAIFSEKEMHHESPRVVDILPDDAVSLSSDVTDDQGDILPADAVSLASNNNQVGTILRESKDDNPVGQKNITSDNLGSTDNPAVSVCTKCQCIIL